MSYFDNRAKNCEYLTFKDFLEKFGWKIHELMCHDYGKSFPDVDIAVDVPQDRAGYDMAQIVGDCESWFGIKQLRSQFESSDLIMEIDMYGGGACRVASAYQGMDGFDIAAEIRRALSDSIECNGYGAPKDEEYVFIEWLKGE